jgi:hypothetical protein
MPVFLTHQLSTQEATQGEALNPIQHRSIQNLIAQIAEQKLRLPFDPATPYAYVQQEAFLQGQIEILEHLLERSDVSNNVINSGE